MPVAVVSDTTGYLPSELLDRYGISVVPLYVVFPDRTVQESEITDYPAYFEELRRADSLPKTSQPSIGDFTAVFEPLLARGDEVVSIHISGGISGTVEAGRQAADQLEREGKGGERVRMVDSATAAGGLGIVTLAAARCAQLGGTVDEVVDAANRARAELKMWFALDTLEFLKRGGRIGAASAWIGSTLKIKPILTVERELSPVERVRTSSRMLERMIDYAQQRHDSGADAWVVQHIAAPDQAKRLADGCQEIFGREPLFISEVGPVLSTHTGPGMLGVGSVPTRFFE
ncbi:MAG TPA: DegV family protein [Thermoleophilaceae bacterium]|nr:DegV family protein [Thermoleophilaceae bacterium]